MSQKLLSFHRICGWEKRVENAKAEPEPEPRGLEQNWFLSLLWLKELCSEKLLTHRCLWSGNLYVPVLSYEYDPEVNESVISIKEKMDSFRTDQKLILELLFWHSNILSYFQWWSCIACLENGEFSKAYYGIHPELLYIWWQMACAPISSET